MKNKICLSALSTLLLTLVLVILSSSASVNAQTFSYPERKLEINLRDDILVITSETSAADEIWSKAGITDIEGTLKIFKEMNVIAAFYDPITKIRVDFLYKQSSKTSELFSFTTMSDDEIISFIENIFESAEDSEFEADIFKHPQIPFFRMTLKATGELGHASELIYGTVVNAELIQFDVYDETGNTIDDKFISEVVTGVNFTKILTKQEYDENVFRARMIVYSILTVIIIIITIAIILSRRRNKHKQEITKVISNDMKEFRNRRLAGEIDTTKPALYVTMTCFNDKLISDYIIYNTWIRSIVSYIVAGVLSAVFIGLMYYTESYTYCFITAAAVIGMVYYTYIKSEKLKKAMMKQYETNKKREAMYRFYDDYFTMTGIGSISEFIYEQITDIRINKDIVYLYMSEQHAVYIDKTKFKLGTYEQFLKFIKAHLTNKI